MPVSFVAPSGHRAKRFVDDSPWADRRRGGHLDRWQTYTTSWPATFVSLDSGRASLKKLWLKWRGLIEPTCQALSAESETRRSPCSPSSPVPWGRQPRRCCTTTGAIPFARALGTTRRAVLVATLGEGGRTMGRPAVTARPFGHPQRGEIRTSPRGKHHVSRERPQIPLGEPSQCWPSGGPARYLAVALVRQKDGGYPPPPIHTAGC